MYFISFFCFKPTNQLTMRRKTTNNVVNVLECSESVHLTILEFKTVLEPGWDT